jgi:hypothetical protein
MTATPPRLRSPILAGLDAALNEPMVAPVHSVIQG